MTHPSPTPIELVTIAEALVSDHPDVFAELVTPYTTTLADAGDLTINMLGLAVGLTGMIGVDTPTLGYAGQPITSGSGNFPPAPLVLTAGLLELIAAGRSHEAGEQYAQTILAAGGDERPVFVRQTLQLAAEILGTVLHVRAVPREG